MSINALNIIPCKTASCPEMDTVASRYKRTVAWGNHKMGDIIMFDFNRNGKADHTGIVLARSGSVIYTIEGNTGNGSNTNGGAVQIRPRTKSTIKRFVRPKYNKDVTPAMVVYTALGEVGTTEYPKNSNKVKYNRWYYGKNTSAYWCMTFVCWDFGNVQKIPKVAKPKTKYTGAIGTAKVGSKGEGVKKVQRFLNWYYPNFKLAVDGECGPKTMRAIMVYQNTEGLSVDADFGTKSLARANTYKGTAKPAKKKTTTTTAKSTTTPAKTTPKTTPKTTNQQKLLATMKELAWEYGTAKKKIDYKSGSPKAVCKKALKKYGWADSKAEMSDCGNNVSATVREAGVSKTFKALHGKKTPFPKTEEDFDIVLKGKKIPSGFLKPSDIVRYKKQNGNQHAQFYFGDGKVCEASHHNRYFAIVKDEKKYNNPKIAKISTVQVLRAKE